MAWYGLLPGSARVRQRPGSLVSIMGVTTLAGLDAAGYHLTARGPGARLLISRCLDSVDLADVHRAGRARPGRTWHGAPPGSSGLPGREKARGRHGTYGSRAGQRRDR